MRRRVFRKAFDQIDHFISPSAYLRDRFVDWGIDFDRISVIANGHTPKRPDDWVAKASENVNIFGFFGQFVDAKGIDVLLQAAAIASKKKKIEVKVFGGNKEYATEDYVTKIDDILAGANKNLKVTEVGPYSRDNVFEYSTKPRLGTLKKMLFSPSSSVRS